MRKSTMRAYREVERSIRVMYIAAEDRMEKRVHDGSVESRGTSMYVSASSL